MLLSRRQFTAALSSLGATQLLRAQPGGGALPPACFSGSSISGVDIDVHCHVFNGSDVQVERFLVSVATRHYNLGLRKVIQALAKPLQRSVWKRAPTASTEHKKLGPLGEGTALQKITPGQLAETYAQATGETDKNYSEGFAEELKTPEGQQFLDAYRQYLESVAASDPKAAEAIRAISPPTELDRLSNPAELYTAPSK